MAKITGSTLISKLNMPIRPASTYNISIQHVDEHRNYYNIILSQLNMSTKPGSAIKSLLSIPTCKKIKY